MRGYRSKFISLLIVYLLGFGTAIYVIVPPDNEQAVVGTSQSGFNISSLKSPEFAQKCSNQLHRCVDFIKAKSCEAGEYIKQKIEERRENS